MDKTPAPPEDGEKRPRPLGFLREKSQVDEGKKFHHSLTGLFLDSGKLELFKKIDEDKNIFSPPENRDDFARELLGELFHDVRSPIISVIGFMQVFRNGLEPAMLGEFSSEALEESENALHRVGTLEEFVLAFLALDHCKPTERMLPDLLDWSLSLLNSKIYRKKVQIEKDYDTRFKNEVFLLKPPGVKLLLVELFLSILKEKARKREKIILQGTADDHGATVIIRIDREGTLQVKAIPSPIKTIFTPEKITVFQLGESGYRVRVDK